MFCAVTHSVCGMTWNTGYIKLILINRLDGSTQETSAPQQRKNTDVGRKMGQVSLVAPKAALPAESEVEWCPGVCNWSVPDEDFNTNRRVYAAWADVPPEVTGLSLRV